ncbi:MAG: hypothetical protein WBF59_25325 [Bradyrhizobium sp.]|uniref:hypothetical protein n=1 Tax=Bradyrhizobium sp. TaxID=376 RepID=UPI003C7463CD
MLKLVSKFAMDIFPSVIATILGAYIVNHYINNKSPATGATAAAVSTAEPKKAVSKADSKPAEKSADLGHIPEPGVRAKGISEKAMIDKSAADKAPVEKANDKADRPSETASIPPVAPESRRHQPAREKEKAAKTAPAPAPAAEPAPAIAPVEAAVTPDANDLARAAIERLRGSEPAPRVQAAEPPKESPKVVEPPRVATAPAASAPAPVPVVAAPSLQPLPPPIVVSTPPAETPPAVARADDPFRPTPPADIPDPHAPLDLRADAAGPPAAKRPSVADDVLSATKKLFNSVLPKQQQ